MTTNAKGERFCDDCGRLIAKAVKIDQGREYCGTCYKREFRPVTCATCKMVSRHHREHTGPYPCPACIQRTRRCVRCEKPIPKKAALVLADGRAVCPCCVSYYRPPAPCTACGALSSRLARLPKYGAHDLICERCQAKLTNRTCSVCYRYRRVAGETAEGKPYCVACEPSRAQTHACSGCGVTVPGSGTGRCRPCLARERLLLAAPLAAAALQRDWNRWLVSEYAQWLAATRSDHVTIVQQFHAHQAFFERLDSTFTYLSDLTPAAFLAQIPVAHLRRFLLPMQFLRERLGLVLTPQAKEIQVETGRIHEIITQAQREPWGALLVGYRDWLTTQDIALRTRRLLLRSAEAFCRTQHLTATEVWSPRAIPAFIKRFPGHRAGLFKFVTYAKTSLSWSVAMPSATGRIKQPSTVQSLAVTMSRITARGVDRVPVHQLARAIATALGFPLADLQTGSWNVEVEGDGVRLIHDQERIEVPSPLTAIVRAWDRRRGVATPST